MYFASLMLKLLNRKPSKARNAFLGKPRLMFVIVQKERSGLRAGEEVVFSASRLICKVNSGHFKAFYAISRVARLDLRRKNNFKFLTTFF